VPAPAEEGPTPARDCVLSTPELLEAILAELDARTLLTSAQRVCRAWRAVVEACPRLQQQLFFRAERQPRRRRQQQPATSSPSSSSSARLSRVEPRRLNPLLTAAFPPLFHPPLTADGSQLPLANRGVRLTAKSMLEKKLPVADMHDGRRRHRAFVRAGASWRDMLVAQPPPRRVGCLRVQDGRFSSQLVDVADGVEGGGLRMGLFFDMVCSAVWGAAAAAVAGAAAAGSTAPPERTEHRHHEVSVCWEPALVGQRESAGLSPEWTGTTPGFPSWWMSGFPKAWVGAVDVVFVEVVRPPGWSPPPALIIPKLPAKLRSGHNAAWMFRCEEFEEVVWAPKPGIELQDADELWNLKLPVLSSS
jgi:hypothetical protein